MRLISTRVVAPASTVLSILLLAPSLCAALPPHTDGLEIEVTKEASCTRKSTDGDNIQVHYRGTLQSDGTEFDSSYNRNVPFEFTLGAGQVIKGWDLGLLDMCIGEGRTLTISPELGYGDRAVGPIPPGSTLIFETELMGIEGVEAPSDTSTDSTTATKADSTATATSTQGSETGPQVQEKDDSGECKLLGSFALLVQGALGLLALLSLVYKRWREVPRRPLKIWSFDASKQVVGSVLLHMANLFMSMLSSGSFDVTEKAKAEALQHLGQDQPNPCSFYLLNLAIDTTIGIPILVIILRVLHAIFYHTPLANPPESIKSGNYGRPPRATWWLKQSFIYFLGLFGMKLCVFFIFQLLPWIAWVGDWALKWTEGNEAIQITFVMFIFPLIMNAMQYYIIDSFIKDPGHGAEEGYAEVADDEEGSDDGSEEEGMEEVSDSEDEDHRKAAGRMQTKETLREVNPTPVPARNDYDPVRDGDVGSSSTSTSLPSDDDDKEKRPNTGSTVR